MACGQSSGVSRDGRHPGIAGKRVTQGEDAGAVPGGGGDVAADGVPVAGDLLGAEPAGDLLLGLRRAHIPLGLVRRRRYPQVGQEAEHVVLAVAQAFRQHAGGRLSGSGAGDAAHLG